MRTLIAAIALFGTMHICIAAEQLDKPAGWFDSTSPSKEETKDKPQQKHKAVAPKIVKRVTVVKKVIVVKHVRAGSGRRHATHHRRRCFLFFC